MASRQRTKVGSSRMDAALDAMRPMGFSPHLVRKCVKNLLKVYGNEGWVVIEEAAYTLLIDTLLDEPVAKQEHEPQNPLLEGGSQSQSQSTDHEKQPAACTMLIDTLLEGPVANQLEHEPQNLLLEGGSQSQATDHEKQSAAYKLLIDTLLEEPVVKQLEHKPQNLLLEGGSQSQATHHEKQPEPVQQLITSDKNVIVEDKKVIVEKTHGNGIIRVRREEQIEEQGSDINVTPMLLQVRTPRSSDIISSKNCARKPCFGWISEGEDDGDDDFLYLEPANGVDPWWMMKN